jgi:CheY-like chemotaxis protein
MNMPLSLTGTRPAADQLSRIHPGLSTPVGLAVLVVDDEAECREEIADALERRGLAVLTAHSAGAALAVLEGRPDIGTLVTDIRMPGTDGLALTEKALAGRDPAQALEVVLVTGYVAPGQALAAERIGACSLLAKPVRGATLGRIVEEALGRAAARRLSAHAAELPEPPIGVPNTAGAATALLATLAQRSDMGAQGLARIARGLRAPLAALLAEEATTDRAATHRALALMDELLEAAAIEDGTLMAQAMPVSAHGLAGAVAGRLGALGIGCGRRIILQPDADPAFRVDMPRMARAIGLLAGAALRAIEAAPATAELSLDAGAGEARLELVIRPAVPRADAETGAGVTLPIAIARRLVAAQGGRMDAWLLPDGVLRARLFLPGA